MLSSNPFINFLLQILTIRGTFNWSVVADNLFSLTIMRGVIITIGLSVISQFVGSVIGLILYFVRRARLLPIRLFGRAYVWFFRGTPLAVQVLAFFTLFGTIGLSRELKAIDIFTPLGFESVYLDSIVAACLAFSLNEGAYMSEIVRAAIDSIEVGQLEAARSLGMTYGLAMRRIVIPQAMRRIAKP
jgi:polar amino acid transport system permease protein